VPFDAHARRSLPFIEPLTLKARRNPFDNPDWLFELKHDGFRGVLYFERKAGARLMSRHGNTFGQFAPLARAAAETLKAESAILDGEIVATTEDGNPRFLALLRGGQHLSFVAFDIMWRDGQDLRALPLTERKEHLRSVLPKRSRSICETLSIEGAGRKLFGAVVERDLEGIVAKRQRQPWLALELPVLP
jgi:bifunctional non-homologous end joining protein LigD